MIIGANCHIKNVSLILSNSYSRLLKRQASAASKIDAANDTVFHDDCHDNIEQSRDTSVFLGTEY